MTTTYHLLHFVPDLTTGTRFTLGAVLGQGGDWRWVEAPQLPPSSYLAVRKQALLKLGLERLRREPEAGLPRFAFPERYDPRSPPTPRLSHLGNHFHVAPPRPLPDETTDPAAWVRDNCLPQIPVLPKDSQQVSGSPSG
jgi:hypothetical protein